MPYLARKANAPLINPKVVSTSSGFSNMDSFKVVLIGGPSVGKSSIFKRYMQGDYSDSSKVTMSASYMEKAV